VECGYYTELQLDAELHATVTWVAESNCDVQNHRLWSAGKRWHSNSYTLRKSGSASSGWVYQSEDVGSDTTPSFRESLTIRDNRKKVGVVGPLVTMTEVTAVGGSRDTDLDPGAEFLAY
jgi:hypothetical protein